MSQFSPAVARRGTFDFHLTTRDSLDYIEWTSGNTSRALLCRPGKPSRPLAHIVFNLAHLLYEVHVCEDGRTFRTVCRHIEEVNAWAAMMKSAHAACGAEAPFIGSGNCGSLVSDERPATRHEGRLIASLPYGYGIVAGEGGMPWFGRREKPLYVLVPDEASCIYLCVCNPKGQPLRMNEPLASFTGPNKEEAALTSLFNYPYAEVRLSGHQRADVVHSRQQGLLAMRQAGGLQALGGEAGKPLH